MNLKPNKMKKKKLLLVTSKNLGDTGKVSFEYIFKANVYDKYPDCCSGPFGYAWKDKRDSTSEVVPFNYFGSGSNIIAAAFGQNQEDKLIEDMPECSNMLCSFEVSELIKKHLGDRMEVIVHVHDDVLLTCYN